jgi:hypothetical protein
MAKGGQKQTTTQSGGLTGASAGLQNDIYNAARNAASGYKTVGPNAATTDALSLFQRLAGAGQNGVAALSGDPAAMAALMNPYQSQVIDESNKQFGNTLDMVRRNVDDAATRAGAFGGSRHGVATGVAMGDAARAHGQEIANLLQSGYSNAQGVAGSLANLGFGAGGQIANIGDYLRGIEQDQANPGVHQLGLLTSGLAGGGTPQYSSTQTTKLPGTSALQNIAGIASLGAGIFTGGAGSLLGSILGKVGGSVIKSPGEAIGVTPAYNPNLGFGGPMAPVSRYGG